MECKSRYAKYWLPFNWALHLLNVALEEKRLDGDIPRNAIAQVSWNHSPETHPDEAKTFCLGNSKLPYWFVSDLDLRLGAATGDVPAAGVHGSSHVLLRMRFLKAVHRYSNSSQLHGGQLQWL